jgi:hypothetical protein
VNWHEILWIIFAIALIVFGVWWVKNNPALFSKENVSKSFESLGILALILIGFIGLLVFLLKHT